MDDLFHIRTPLHALQGQTRQGVVPDVAHAGFEDVFAEAHMGARPENDTPTHYPDEPNMPNIAPDLSKANDDRSGTHEPRALSDSLDDAAPPAAPIPDRPEAQSAPSLQTRAPTPWTFGAATVSQVPPVPDTTASANIPAGQLIASIGPSPVHSPLPDLAVSLGQTTIVPAPPSAVHGQFHPLSAHPMAAPVALQTALDGSANPGLPAAVHPGGSTGGLRGAPQAGPAGQRSMTDHSAYGFGAGRGQSASSSSSVRAAIRADMMAPAVAQPGTTDPPVTDRALFRQTVVGTDQTGLPLPADASFPAPALAERTRPQHASPLTSPGAVGPHNTVDWSGAPPALPVAKEGVNKTIHHVQPIGLQPVDGPPSKGDGSMEPDIKRSVLMPAQAVSRLDPASLQSANTVPPVLRSPTESPLRMQSATGGVQPNDAATRPNTTPRSSIIAELQPDRPVAAPASPTGVLGPSGALPSAGAIPSGSFDTAHDVGPPRNGRYSDHRAFVPEAEAATTPVLKMAESAWRPAPVMAVPQTPSLLTDMSGQDILRAVDQGLPFSFEIDGRIGPVLSPGVAANPTLAAAASAGQAPVIAQQIANGLLTRDTDRGTPLDLALDPPELGRLRLSVTEISGALTLTITADRPETADLMRRHVSILAEELSRAGVDAPHVTISEGRDKPQGRNQRSPAHGTSAQGAEVEAVAAAPAGPPDRSFHGPDSGLDIRL